jgi:hypothetical protein
MAVAAIARLTFADAVRQPATWLATGVSLALLGLSWVFGMFNFEDQDRLRMLSTAGVAIAVVNGLFLAVVGAAASVHDELADRTALTLFAKPVPRSAFLLGKAAGIWGNVLIASLVLLSAHLGALALAKATGFELVHDDHHHGADPDLRVEWAAVVAAHALGWLHSACLTAIAAVLAIRLGLVANILACFALFVGGHLLLGLGWTGAGPVPALAVFNLDDAIQLGTGVSSAYLALTGLYTALFCAGWLLVGAAILERQDIR